MVNKLLIGLGIVALVALVAVGSIGVWQLAAGDGGRQVGALGDEPLKDGPSGALRWRGTRMSRSPWNFGGGPVM